MELQKTSSQEAPVKKIYASPVLQTYGSLAEITGHTGRVSGNSDRTGTGSTQNTH
jgi:hypothetical protein